MKKQTSFYFILIIFALLSFLNTGCINFSDSSAGASKPRPDIDCTSTSIKITIPKISSDTSYINIYRKEVEKSDSSETDTASTGVGVNIGVIFPSEFDADNTTYLYEDLYVVEKKSYSYRVRYYDKKENEFTYTDWTTVECLASTGATSEDDFKYDVTDVYFNYSKVDQTLTLKNGSALITPSYFEGTDAFDSKKGDFTTVFALKTDKKAQIFEFSEEQLNNETPISLLGILPSDFYDTKIEVVGLIAQKIETITKEDGASSVKRVYWLQPTPIKLKTGEVELLDEGFSVGTQTGTNGFDYSASKK